MDSGYVRIIEARSAFRFFYEAEAVRGVRVQVRSEPLECNGAVQFGVFRAIYLTHSALSQPFTNQETPPDGSGEGLHRRSRVYARGLGFRHRPDSREST